MSYVYAVNAGEYVKFGMTADLDSRIRSMQTGCPLEIVVVGYVRGGSSLEAAVHQFFSPHRERGEWFSMHDSMRNILEAFKQMDRDKVHACIGYEPKTKTADLQPLIEHDHLRRRQTTLSINKMTKEEAVEILEDAYPINFKRLYRRS